jgi:phospholipase/carboxylesterase
MIEKQGMAAEESIEFIAEGPVSGKAKQLVVLLHGLGFNAEHMLGLALAVRERLPDALVVMPRGLERFSRGTGRPDNFFTLPVQLAAEAKPAFEQRQWFPIDGTWAEIQANMERLAPRLNAFIDAQRDALGIEDENIALMGFSQGGGVALATAFSRHSAIGCVVGHSTLVRPDKSFTAKPPTLFIYGTADEEFSAAKYEEIIQDLRDYLAEVDVGIVPGLSHRTSSASRMLAADYIAHHLRNLNP